MDESFFSVLPPALAAGLRALPAPEREAVQELRLRCGRLASYLAGGQERVLPCGAKGYEVDAACLRTVVNKATLYSRYAAGDQLRQGFVTLPGGHRLGLCGQAVTEDGTIRTLKEITSVNLRIARQHRGVGAQAGAFLRRHPGSTLIAGPPGCGKTTLLRELIRSLSDTAGQRVGVVDERFELAACHDGSPGFDLGCRTDVLSGAGKEEGVYMLLRTMNPDWIAVDEITDDRDLDALLRSSFCGVRILATAHIFSRADLTARPLYARMCAAGLFENLIRMDKQHGMVLERMISNGQAPGRSADRDLCGLGGYQNVPERAGRGSGAAAAPAGAGADALRDPGQPHPSAAAV